jgi:two-component system sensor histidine kinase KdpD
VRHHAGVIDGDVARVRLSPARVGSGCVVALLGAGALILWRTPSTEGDVAAVQPMAFLGVAVLAALVGGATPALVAVALGAAALADGFTRPDHTLAETGSAERGTFVVYVVVGVLACTAFVLADRRRRRLLRTRAQADLLAAVNLAADRQPDVEALMKLVRLKLGLRRAELLDDAPPDAGGRRVTVVDAGSSVLVLRGRRLDADERRTLGVFAVQLGASRDRAVAATGAVEAERRLRATLLASAADQLRAPLAILRSATDMVRVAGDRLPDADRVELHELARETSGRLARMTDDLRELGRLQAGLVRARLTGVDLDEVVRRACAGIAAKHILVGPLPTIPGDAALLERALSNLLATATRYSDRVEILGERRGPRFELRVVDHGPGISPTDWPGLFEPFRRMDDLPDSEGVALSLAVVRGLVEAQGGTVRAEVTLGGGLTIVLDLAAG